MDFSGFDPAAELRIEGDTLTLCFRFTDEATAQAAAAALIECHERGEEVTITLARPWGLEGDGEVLQ